jgi:hypothetical protein
MSSDLAAFEALENRLGELERRVHGNQVKKNEDMIIVPKLTGIAQEIGDCIGKKERIIPLFRRLNELEKHLEPASAAESGLSLEARAEVILNEEKQLRQTNNLLEQVKSKKSVLDSETLKNVASMEGKLLELTKLHLDQQSQCEDWSNEALDLVEQYNGLIDTLTQTFVEYDKVLTAAEEAAEIK